MASEDASLAYFFCDRNQEDRSDPLEVLLSITKQLSWVAGQKYVRQCTVEAYNRKKNDNFASNMFTPEECQNILLRLAAEIRQSFIIVDGLDECNERTRGDLLKTLDHLVRHSTSVIKVFVASRNDRDLTQHFSNSPNLDIKASHNQDDIEKLVVDRISNNEWAAEHMTIEVRQKVALLFREKSQGMYVMLFSVVLSDNVMLTLTVTRFQWAALHIDDLLEIESNKDTLKWLNSLPKGLEAAYDRIYHSIEEKGDRWLIYANRAFMWLMFSSTPIPLEILCILVCQDAGDEFNPEAKLSRASLLSFCRNCIKVDWIDGIQSCRFAHLSVQEYLEHRRLNTGEVHRMAWGILEKYGHWCAGSPSNTHALGVSGAFMQHMAYLSVSNFIRSAEMCEMEEDSWDILLRSANGHDVILGSPIWQSFDGYESFPGQAWTMKPPGRRWLTPYLPVEDFFQESTDLAFGKLGLLAQRSDLKGPIGMCVRHNITRPVEYWLKHQMFNPKTDCVTAQALLFAAWQKQHFSICNMLLDAGTTFKSESRDVLGPFVDMAIHYAPRDGPNGTLLKFMKRLFEGGASAAGLRRRQLNQIVFSKPDTFEIAQLLLENGAGANPLEGEDVNPPLNCAVGRGDANIETTKLLLRHGAEVKKSHGDWESAIQSAANSRDASMKTLELLLEHGADPNMWSPKFCSPLQYAVFRQNVEAVKLLLVKGADINAVSDGNGTALHIAASHGPSGRDLYDLLLANGADPSIQCYLRDTWYLKGGQYTAEQIHHFMLGREYGFGPL